MAFRFIHPLQFFLSPVSGVSANNAKATDDGTNNAGNSAIMDTDPVENLDYNKEFNAELSAQFMQYASNPHNRV
jgi:hypothetical protein